VSINIRLFNPEDAEAWDNFCKDSLQATLLHTRRFLSYHGDRFEDRSLILEEGGNWVGLFPAAISPDESTCIVSHPGITYGGMLHKGELNGEQMVAALEAAGRYYATHGYTKLIYKAVPTFYHRSPAQDDLYALFRMGARRIRCDISSTIDLGSRLLVSQRRKRSLKKAIKNGVSVVDERQYLAELWDVLAGNLVSKHGVKPVHTLADIVLLAEMFPAEIRCVCGVLRDVVVAGTLIFVTPTTFHAQYIASSEEGYDVSALDAVFEYCIDEAQNCGKRWFDFGISTESGGQILNKGLYGFKSEFGSGSTVHEFYELDLHK
jgi:Acetyltransferase (GNAT) domain